mmetsp:Transcript_26344/g.34616  ORF Transcript_26344/g.34616 Transcript_26344/m.34616 type:complete len:234 (+) Transcript_26344:374-1075(+)
MSAGIWVTGFIFNKLPSENGLISIPSSRFDVSNMPFTIFIMDSLSSGFTTTKPSSKKHCTISSNLLSFMARIVLANLYRRDRSTVVVCPQSSSPIFLPGIRRIFPGWGSALNKPSLNIMCPQAFARTPSILLATALPILPLFFLRSIISSFLFVDSACSLNRERGTPSKNVIIKSLELANLLLGIQIFPILAARIARFIRSIAPASFLKSNSLSICFSSSTIGVTKSWLISYF